MHQLVILAVTGSRDHFRSVFSHSVRLACGCATRSGVRPRLGRRCLCSAICCILSGTGWATSSLVRR